MNFKTEAVDNLKVPGYRGRWYEIDRMRVGAITYVLLEHCTYGDETCGLVIKLLSDSGFELVCETYDDVKTALEDEGVYEDE